MSESGKSVRVVRTTVKSFNQLAGYFNVVNVITIIFFLPFLNFVIFGYSIISAEYLCLVLALTNYRPGEYTHNSIEIIYTARIYSTILYTISSRF